MDNIQNFKCPCCDAGLEFYPLNGKLHCSSCGNYFEVVAMQQMTDAENSVLNAVLKGLMDKMMAGLVPAVL